jgi:hypothetical protein
MLLNTTEQTQHDRHGHGSRHAHGVVDPTILTSYVLIHRARGAFQRAFSALAARQTGHIGCGFAQELALSIVGRAVSGQERRAMAAHARTCPECRSSLRTADKSAVGMGLFLAPLSIPAALHPMPPLPLPALPAPVPTVPPLNPVGTGLLAKLTTVAGAKIATGLVLASSIGGGALLGTYESRSHHLPAPPVTAAERASGASLPQWPWWRTHDGAGQTILSAGHDSLAHGSLHDAAYHAGDAHAGSESHASETHQPLRVPTSRPLMRRHRRIGLGHPHLEHGGWRSHLRHRRTRQRYGRTRMIAPRTDRDRQRDRANRERFVILG